MPTQAKYSIFTAPGDGVKTSWEFNFSGAANTPGYISRDHVVAYRTNRDTKDIVAIPLTNAWVGPNTVLVEPPVPVTDDITIKRITPKVAPLVDYTSGSLLNERNLDMSNRQAIYAVAELVDAAGESGDGSLTESVAYEALAAATVAGQVAQGAQADTDDLRQSLTTNGAALLPFIQRGLGALRRTVQSKLRDVISVTDYMTPEQVEDVLSGTGALDVGLACDTALVAVVAGGCRAALYFPGGRYRRTDTWNFSWPTLHVYGDGVNTVLFSTVAGTVVKVDDSLPNHNEYAFSHQMSDFTIEGTFNARILLYLGNLNHVVWNNLNLREASPIIGTAFVINGSVCGRFSNLRCSTNAQPMTSRPFTGLVVDRQQVHPFTRATDNLFDNCIFEGAHGDGWQLVNSDQSIFIGGTSENHDGNGCTVAAGSRMNTFIGVAFENTRGFADVYDAGELNLYLNCYSTSLFYMDTSCRLTRVEGGFHHSINVQGDFCTVSDIHYSRMGAGGTLVLSPNTSARNTFNAHTRAMTFNVKPARSVAVGPSPFTYVNGSGMSETVVASGATQIVLTRGGDPVANLGTGAALTLGPTDGLVISHTGGSPVLTVLPGGSNYV